MINLIYFNVITSEELNKIQLFVFSTLSDILVHQGLYSQNILRLKVAHNLPI